METMKKMPRVGRYGLFSYIPKPSHPHHMKLSLNPCQYPAIAAEKEVGTKAGFSWEECLL
jgi:hypothetical protein